MIAGGTNGDTAPSIDHIIRVTASRFGVSARDILSSRQDAAARNARGTAMWLSRRLTPNSYPQIARRFDKRHHTTIIAAVKRIDARLEADAELGQVVLDLINFLTAPRTAA